MGRNLCFAILASVFSLGLMGTESSAPAAEARQDNYCLQGTNPATREIVGSQVTSSASPSRAAQTKAVGSTR
jgi:hypothetical protein